MSLLGEALQLHDVRNAEAFCRRIALATLGSRAARLDRGDFDDLLTYLIGDAWQLATYAYHPKGGAASAIIGARVKARTATRREWRGLRRYARARKRLARHRDIAGLDALGHAFAAAIAELGYEVGTVTFEEYASRVMPGRVWSWYRQRWRDTRYKSGQGASTTTHLPDSDDEVRGDIDPSLVAALSTLDVRSFKPHLQYVHEAIALPIYERGMTREQVAAEIGWGKKRVSDALRKWKAEVRAKCLVN